MELQKKYLIKFVGEEQGVDWENIDENTVFAVRESDWRAFGAWLWELENKGIDITVDNFCQSIGPPDGREITVDLSDGATMEFMRIEPGTFTMGTTTDQEQLMRSKGLWYEDFENERPAHEVTISKDFYLGKYELTEAQLQSVMDTSPVWGPNYPAYLSWQEAQEFIHRLNEVSGDSLYRLPTEAEWEYACRAGTTTLWSFGDDEERSGNFAWFYENSQCKPQPVGLKLPNPWGLYDMHGNVWEWCQDQWYKKYTTAAQIDPVGLTLGTNYIVRGGGCCYEIVSLRSALRDYGGLRDDRIIISGVRVLKMATLD